MRFVMVSLLVLCAGTGSWAKMIDDPGPAPVRLNFELCRGFEAIAAAEHAGAELLPMEGASQWGSLTGLLDFGETDGYLRYLDEYVMAILPSGTLYSVLYGLLPGADAARLHPDSVVVVNVAEDDYPSL